MDSALLSGISGMRAHQTMIDVAGNNLANVSTTAFKTSRVTFADQLNNTLREASQPSGDFGGTNPMQVGTGVAVASIDRNVTQGTIQSTGQPLDMAINGSGYFVLSNQGTQYYTRAGSFAVDSANYLVDPSTGYRLQRFGNVGVNEGFQANGDTSIHIPYNQAMKANGTTVVDYTGNLSPGDTTAARNVLESGLSYTVGGSVAGTNNTFDQLDQVSGGALSTTDAIHVSGTTADGTTVSADYSIYDAANSTYKTLGDFLSFLNTTFPGTDATMNQGQIIMTDSATGYSQTDVSMSYTPGTAGGPSIQMPTYFTLATAGGEAVQPTSLSIYDNQGNSYTLSATFVKTKAQNTWDLVINSVAGPGDVTLTTRRINGIQFLSDGSFKGLADPTAKLDFTLSFAKEGNITKTISVNLGDPGMNNGITQCGTNGGSTNSSTATASSQDGYPSGWLSSLSISQDGMVEGVFDNGIRRDIAQIQLATFQNAAGLEDIGNNYFITSANSGVANATTAQSNGAGAIQGQSLEKSNVDVATEFVNLIQAQNGFQANARTIKVSNDMMTELTSLLR